MQNVGLQLNNIVELLDTNNVQAIQDVFADAHPADIADTLESLTPTKRLTVWLQIPQILKGEVLAELSEGVLRDLAGDIDKEQLVDSIKSLDVDDIADLVHDLPHETLEDVLVAVDSNVRDSLDEVLSFPDDSAGGLMNLDATVVRDNITLEVVLRFLRLKNRLPSQTDSIYLVDSDHHLTGVLPIDRLITSPAEDLAITHIIDNPVTFDGLDHEEDVAKAYADYDLVSAPVVNENKRLIGRITIDDVVDVIREQAA